MTTPDTNVGREQELAWQNIETAEIEFLNNLADRGGLDPIVAGMLRHCARLIATLRTPTSARGEDAAIGWKACRRQVFALCEHTQDTAGDNDFERGRAYEAKHIAKAMNAFGPEDCDELAVALATPAAAAQPKAEVVDDAAVERALANYHGNHHLHPPKGTEWHRMHSALTAALSMQDAGEGWVLVPREPTPEMRLAGKHTLKGAADSPEWQQAMSVYASMLAATPSRPSARQPSGEVVAWTTPESLKMLRDPECGVGLMHCRRTDYISVPLYTPLDDAVEK